jgi:ectoine hydroxylase-related dioxygenase (phytanoyl-CoA dioxygenase family)
VPRVSAIVWDVGTIALTRLPAETPVAEVAEHLRRHGYAIVERLVDDATMDRLATEAEPYIAASDPGRDHYDGRQTRRTGALVARCETARQLIMHPLALGVARDVLSHASAVQLHLTQIITIGPGETQQKLHRDQMAFDCYPFGADYHVQCNTMWALTDFTAANGGTHIIPGTSAIDEAEGLTLPGGQVEMPRGSVLFYDGKVLHGGGANTTDEVRQGVNITYSVGWVRQEENQYLACPPEVARTLDDDLLRVMGYQQGAFALGYVGDQTDALAALRGDTTKVKVVSEFADNNEGYAEFVAALETPDAATTPIEE